MLNFNTLGHLSLRSNPGSVRHQTSYFLIWFGSKVVQERERKKGGGRRGGDGGDGVELRGWVGRWCSGGSLLNEILMCGGRGGLGRGIRWVIRGRGTTPSTENDAPPERRLRLVTWGARKGAFDDVSPHYVCIRDLSGAQEDEDRIASDSFVESSPGTPCVLTSICLHLSRYVQ